MPAINILEYVYNSGIPKNIYTIIFFFSLRILSQARPKHQFNCLKVGKNIDNRWLWFVNPNLEKHSLNLQQRDLV